MCPATKKPDIDDDAEVRLEAFVAKFDAKDQALIRAVRKAMRGRFPTCHELVYDNYNFFVIGYSPTLRPSDAFVSIAARANGLGICFIDGAKLPDPGRRLLGSGHRTRFIRVADAAALRDPEIEDLFSAAVAVSKVPLPTSGRGTLVIRAVSAKQRPRRSAAPVAGAKKAAQRPSSRTRKA